VCISGVVCYVHAFFCLFPQRFPSQGAAAHRGVVFPRVAGEAAAEAAGRVGGEAGGAEVPVAGAVEELD
jgi:hypothetical protein